MGVTLPVVKPVVMVCMASFITVKLNSASPKAAVMAILNWW